MNVRRQAAPWTDLATAATKAREWTLKRDELIRQMRAEGATLRTIGAVSGLTHTGVKRILDRESV